MSMTFSRVALASAAMVLLLAGAAGGDQPPCSGCPAWNVAQPPFQIFGNTYYVGVRGLSAILITSPQGHVLIDGALSQSAASIAGSIRALGFRIEDVKLILNSHVHFDHAGGIAELQRLSGARVAASQASARVLMHGGVGRDDPQFGILRPIRAVRRVQTFVDGETLRVGPLAVTAHLTPGHTPGGTSWTWSSCENGRCLNIVYADSLSAVSSDDFLFTRNQRYPHAIQDFERSFAALSALPCDVLVSTHPEVSGLWERLARREQGDANALVDATACGRYVARAREGLAKRVAEEAARSPKH